MYQNERLEKILRIIKENGYVTVKYLIAELHYSNATINRDLNILEGQKLIRRSYGGVELIAEEDARLPFRYHKMHSEKLKIAKKAAEFVKDGDTIFIDASTTSEYMKEFLTDKKDLTIITNNMALVAYLSEYGIDVICLGGKVVEQPSMLDGAETVENAMKYHADKMFFSVTGIDSERGMIVTSDTYYLMHQTMAKNSKEVYFLIDRGKIDVVSKKYLFSLEKVQVVISDYIFSDELKQSFPKTVFIEV